jgi:hypothetical protein
MVDLESLLQLLDSTMKWKGGAVEPAFDWLPNQVKVFKLALWNRLRRALRKICSPSIASLASKLTGGRACCAVRLNGQRAAAQQLMIFAESLLALHKLDGHPSVNGQRTLTDIYCL